jgi:hypothetical protein
VTQSVTPTDAKEPSYRGKRAPTTEQLGGRDNVRAIKCASAHMYECARNKETGHPRISPAPVHIFRTNLTT